MDIKRYALSVFAGFIFVFIYEFIVHGILLIPTYDQTPSLWRSVEDMQNYIPFSTIIQLMTTAILAYIFTLNYEAKGLVEGLRFGVIFGLIFGLYAASPISWMPISAALAFYWFIATFVKTVILGLIFSFIYKR